MRTGGGSFGCIRSPYALVVAIPIAWRKAGRMVRGEVGDLPLVGGSARVRHDGDLET
jgi:hypothetical protein